MDCSTCIFADTTPPTSGGPFGLSQCGCKVNRLDTLIERGEASLVQPILDGEQVNYYKLSRFCNMYRTSKWKRDSFLGQISWFASSWFNQQIDVKKRPILCSQFPLSCRSRLTALSSRTSYATLVLKIRAIATSSFEKEIQCWVKSLQGPLSWGVALKIFTLGQEMLIVVDITVLLVF